MHPILLSLGFINIYSYGFMVAIGFFAGIITTYFLSKKLLSNPDRIFDVSLFVLIGSIVGARLVYVVFYWHELKSPIDAFKIWQGGLVFYGGLVFGILGLILACKFFKIPVIDVLDAASVGTILGYAIGRIGCFLNGCCYGIECSLPWAVKFINLEGLRHPTQIYSSISGLIIVMILLFVFNRRKFPGQVFSLSILLYSFYRFFIEFFRTNPRIFLNLTTAQYASVALFVFGIISYIYGKSSFKNRN